MVSEKDLRDIIAQVLTEMNVGAGDSAVAGSVEKAVKASCENCTEIEDGCLEDVAAIDLRTQYLIENPVSREAYYDLKQYAPCRLGIEHATVLCRYWNSGQPIPLHRMRYFPM